VISISKPFIGEAEKQAVLEHSQLSQADLEKIVAEVNKL
jgi:hypothetical protein